MSHELNVSTTIPNLPKSTILSLDFANVQNTLVLGSINFDGALDIYNLGMSSQYQNKTSSPARLCGTSFPTPCSSMRIDSANRVCYVGMGDGKIAIWNIATNQTTQLGEHLDICNNVRWLPQYNILVSSGLDGFVKYWDPRTSQAQGQISLKAPIVAMDASGNTIISGCNDRSLQLIDLRNPMAIASTPKYDLEHHIVSLTAMHNNEGFVYSSYEGRARVEFLNNPQSSFPFRSHRGNAGNLSNTTYPFSSMACHPQTNILATAGCDGTINLWDFYSRKKRSHSPSYGTSISACAFSPEGQILAYAIGYNYYGGAQKPAWIKDNYQIVISGLTSADLKVVK